MSLVSVSRAGRNPRRWIAPLLAVSLLVACQHAPEAELPPEPPRARSTEEAAAFETWLQPRLNAVQVLLEASQQGVDLVALVMRARQPGSGVAPPPLAPARAGVEAATIESRRRLAGTGPLVGGDSEQTVLARDAELQVAEMIVGLRGFADALPQLDGVARALGPLRREDGFALSNSLARLLAVQVRADSVFAVLVVGLLTPEASLLPERELQLVRRLGNETLLESLRQFADYGHAGAAAETRRDAARAAIARQRGGLAAAARKLDALRAAGAELPDEQRAPLAQVVRSYEDGLGAERDFLDALEHFAPLVYAVDRDAPDVELRLLAAFEGARWLMDRVVLRLQTNLARLRTLSDIGRGRRA